MAIPLPYHYSSPPVQLCVIAIWLKNINKVQIWEPACVLFRCIALVLFICVPSSICAVWALKEDDNGNSVYSLYLALRTRDASVTRLLISGSVVLD